MRGLPDLRSPRAPVPEPPPPYEPVRTTKRLRARFSYRYGWRDKILEAGREALAGEPIRLAVSYQTSFEACSTSTNTAQRPCRVQASVASVAYSVSETSTVIVPSCSREPLTTRLKEPPPASRRSCPPAAPSPRRQDSSARRIASAAASVDR